MSIPISSPIRERLSQEEHKTPSPKRRKTAIAEQIQDTPSPLKDTPSPLRGAFKLTPGRVIRPGTPSKKHYPKVLGKGGMKSREYHKLCKSLKGRLMHTFASPNASPKSTKRNFRETVVVEEDGHITSPRGTKYSAHREPDADGEHVIYPVRGPRMYRCSGADALRIVKRLRKGAQAQILQKIEAAIEQNSSTSSSSSSSN